MIPHCLHRRYCRLFFGRPGLVIISCPGGRHGGLRIQLSLQVKCSIDSEATVTVHVALSLATIRPLAKKRNVTNLPIEVVKFPFNGHKS